MYRDDCPTWCEDDHTMSGSPFLGLCRREHLTFMTIRTEQPLALDKTTSELERVKALGAAVGSSFLPLTREQADQVRPAVVSTIGTPLAERSEAQP